MIIPYCFLSVLQGLLPSNQVISGRKCLCCGLGRVIKHGFFPRFLEDGSFSTSSGSKVYVQRWLCKECGRTMSTPSSLIVAYKHYDARVIGRALYLYYQMNMSVEKVKTELDGPSFSTIRNWVRQFRGRAFGGGREFSKRFGIDVNESYSDCAKEVFSMFVRYCECFEDGPGIRGENVVVRVQQLLLESLPRLPLFRSD